MDKPDLLIIGLDRQAFDLAMAAAALGGRVVVATHGRSGVDQAIRDGEFLARMVAVRQLREPRFEQRRLELIEWLRRMRSPERLRAARITVIDSPAKFLDSRRVAIAEQVIEARRTVLATGRRAGNGAMALEEALRSGEIPARAILRGGAMALDAAVLLASTGARITYIPDFPAGGAPDPDMLSLLLTSLERQGIQVSQELPQLRSVDLPIWEPGALQPDLDGLDIEAAGLRMEGSKLLLGSHLETSQSRIAVLGSVAGVPYGALENPATVGYLLARLLFRKSGRYQPPPPAFALSQSPRLVQIGPGEKEARGRFGAISVFRAESGEIRPDPEPTSVKILLDRRQKLIGASAFGPEADCLVPALTSAVAGRLSLESLATLSLPPGSAGDVLRLAAAAPKRALLRSPLLQRLMRVLRFLG